MGAVSRASKTENLLTSFRCVSSFSPLSADGRALHTEHRDFVARQAAKQKSVFLNTLRRQSGVAFVKSGQALEQTKIDTTGAKERQPPAHVPRRE